MLSDVVPSRLTSLKRPGDGVVVLATGSAVLAGLALHFGIAYAYSNLIVERFGGIHSDLQTSPLLSAMSYAVSALCSGACGWYCAKRPGPSRIIVSIHLVAVIVPLQALVSTGFELAQPVFAFGIAGCYLIAISLAVLIPDLRLPPLKSSTLMLLVVAAVVMTVYLYGALVVTGGLERLNFDLNIVYDVRDEFLENSFPMAGYFVPWQGYVVNPLVIVVGLRRRSASLLLLGLALQLLLFSMTGYRAFLFMPLGLLALFWFNRTKLLTALILTGAVCLMGLAGIWYIVFDEPLLPSIFIYRLFVIPAELHYWYYDFFGTRAQPLLHFSQSIVSGFADSYYREPIAATIGWFYLGSAASANVGMFADAYANFGFAGSLGVAILFAVVLKSLDSAARNVDPRVAAALICTPAFQLANSGLQTTLSTHGLAFLALTLWAVGSFSQGRTAASAGVR
jgi:hypothetical protein